MTTTAPWNETLHPREQSGKFDIKSHTAPELDLAHPNEEYDMSSFLQEPPEALPFEPYTPVIYTFPDGYEVKANVTSVGNGYVTIGVDEYLEDNDPEDRMMEREQVVEDRYVRINPDTDLEVLRAQSEAVATIRSESMRYAELSGLKRAGIDDAGAADSVRMALELTPRDSRYDEAVNRMDRSLMELAHRGLISSNLAYGLMDSALDGDLNAHADSFAYGELTATRAIEADVIEKYADRGWVDIAQSDLDTVRGRVQDGLRIAETTAKVKGATLRIEASVDALTPEGRESIGAILSQRTPKQTREYNEAADRVAKAAQALYDNDLIPRGQSAWLREGNDEPHAKVLRAAGQAELVRAYQWLTHTPDEDLDLLASTFHEGLATARMAA